MTSDLQIAVMRQDRPIEFDENDMVDIPDVCGRSWWGFLHRWAETIRDDGCGTCGEHAVLFVSAMHDLVNIKLMGEGDPSKKVYDPENFVKTADIYHKSVHAAGLECPICDQTNILAPVAQVLPHSHVAETRGERSALKFQPSLFDPPIEPELTIVPGPPADTAVDDFDLAFPVKLKPFRFETKLVRQAAVMNPPTITSPSEVFTMAKDLIDSDRERLLVLFTDTRAGLIGVQEITVGTKNTSLVPIDVVARTAILSNTTGVFVVHNHPSGDPTPSDEDVAITRTLFEGLKLLDIDLVDHIVIGQGRFVSLREKSLGPWGSAAAGQGDEFTYPEIFGTAPKLTTSDIATMAQDPKIRISGTCEHDGPCKIKVRAVDEVVKSIDSAELVGEAVEEAHRQLLARRSGNVTDRTFAIGANSVTRYQFQFRVVPAEDLIVSNDPFTFLPNPEYPEELQPRDRARTATKLQVEKLAANLQPDALLEDFRVLDRGTPIVGPDLIVEGGNGRTMALILAAAEFPQMYGEYKLRLIDRLGEFGIDPADIEGIETPVLVRVRLSDVDRVRFAAETNTPVGISTSSIESASEDANRITVDMLMGLDLNDGEGLGDALRATRNAPFVRSFLSKLNSNEQAELVDSDGLVNQDGIRRIVLGVFVSTFPGDDGIRLAELAFESIDLQIRNVVNALSQSLGPLATAEALVQAGERQEDLAIAGDIASAVIVFAKIKSTPGQIVEMFLNQSQLFARELTPFQEELLQFLDVRSRSARRIANAILNYAILVQGTPPPQQVALIPGAEITKQGLWNSAVSEADVGMAAQTPRESIDWCNLDSNGIDDVWGWRPIRELLTTAALVGAVIEVCGIGFGGTQIQVTIDTRLVLPTSEQPTGILRAAERLGGFGDRILVQDPGVFIWTVKLPSVDETNFELIGQVPEPSTPKFEPSEQPVLFQGSRTAPMGQDSFISRLSGGTAFGLGGEIVRAVVSNIKKATTATAGKSCADLSPQALSLDISGSGDFVRERIEDPEKFDDRSFRTVVQDDHMLIVACPVGTFDPDRSINEQCVDGLELQSVLHPRKSCVAELVVNAEDLGISIVDDGMSDEIEAALDKAGLPSNSRNGASEMAKAKQNEDDEVQGITDDQIDDIVRALSNTVSRNIPTRASVIDQVAGVLRSAQSVVDSFESGDLAGAVNSLAFDLRQTVEAYEEAKRTLDVGQFAITP